MACFLSFANCWSFCLIGHAVLLTSSVCSTSSLGTPGMLDGLHAKMTVLSLRKLVSASSYLGSRLAPMTSSFDASGRPWQTFLTAGHGSRAVLVPFEGPIRRTREGGSEWEQIKILLEGDGNSYKMNTASNTRLRLTSQVGQAQVATGVPLDLGTNTHTLPTRERSGTPNLESSDPHRSDR
jgi:hypothetical protein